MLIKPIENNRFPRVSGKLVETRANAYKTNRKPVVSGDPLPLQDGPKVIQGALRNINKLLEIVYFSPPGAKVDFLNF